MSSPHRFVVRRQVYTPPDAAGVRRLLPEKHERIATFPKAEAAFADCAKRLAEFRRTTNPFQLGGPCLFYQTNLPPFALHDYLLDHGLTPPPTSLNVNPNYVFWWVKNSRAFTDREREAVWSACDKLTPFEVIEEDDRKAVHVVVEVPFDNDDEPGMDDWPHSFAWEGGWVQECHSQFRTARIAAKRWSDESKVGREELRFHWPRDTPTEVLDGSDVDFAETVAVSGNQPPTSGPVHLSLRQSFRASEGGYEMHSFPAMCNLGARVPLLWFANEADGNAQCQALTASARHHVNPFALVWPDGFNWYTLSDHGDEATLPNGLAIDDAIEIVRKLPTIPPAPEVLSAEWYDRVVQWSPEFVDVIWATFADFRLFEVTEVPLG